MNIMGDNHKKNWVVRVLALGIARARAGADRVILTICNIKSKECVGGMTARGVCLKIRQSRITLKGI